MPFYKPGDIFYVHSDEWASPHPITYSREWTRDGDPIADEDDVVYTIVSDDSMAEVRCEVTATNLAGSTTVESNAVIPVDFLTWDEYTDARAAGSVNSTAATPGPGTRTVIDGNNKLSVSDGQLSFATGGVGAGNPSLRYEQEIRTAGKAVIAQATRSGNAFMLGWDVNTTGAINDGFRFVSTTSLVLADGNVVDTGAQLTISVTYQIAVVQRSSGFFAFIKGSQWPNWTLMWIGVASTGNHYPAVSAIGATSVGTVDYLRVVDLPAPFTDYGLSTDRKEGSVSAATTYIHEADMRIEYICTTRPSSGNMDVVFRKTDANNYWICRINSSGDISLQEVVAGVATQRANAAGVVTNGHRIIITAFDEVIRGYGNNTLHWTYSSAATSKTATAGELASLGTGGAVSDLVSWPRVLGASAAAILDHVHGEA